MRVEELIERLREVPPHYEVRLTKEMPLEKEDLRVNQAGGIVGIVLPKPAEDKRQMLGHDRPCDEAWQCPFYDPKVT